MASTGNEDLHGLHLLAHVAMASYNAATAVNADDHSLPPSPSRGSSPSPQLRGTSVESPGSGAAALLTSDGTGPDNGSCSSSGLTDSNVSDFPERIHVADMTVVQETGVSTEAENNGENSGNTECESSWDDNGIISDEGWDDGNRSDGSGDEGDDDNTYTSSMSSLSVGSEYSDESEDSSDASEDSSDNDFMILNELQSEQQSAMQRISLEFQYPSGPMKLVTALQLRKHTFDQHVQRSIRTQMASSYLPKNSKAVMKASAEVYPPSLQFSSSGKYLVVGVNGIQVFSVQQRDLVEYKFLDTAVDGPLAISPDEQYIVCLRYRYRRGAHLYLMPLAEGLQEHELQGSHTGCMQHVEFSAVNPEILMDARCVSVYDIESGKTVFSIFNGSSTATAARFADLSSNLIIVPHYRSRGRPCPRDPLCVYDRRICGNQGRSVPPSMSSMTLSGYNVSHVCPKLDGCHFLTVKGGRRSVLPRVDLWDLRMVASRHDNGQDTCERPVKTFGSFDNSSPGRFPTVCGFSPYPSTGQRLVYAGSHPVNMFDINSGSVVAEYKLKDCANVDIQSPLSDRIAELAWHPSSDLIAMATSEGHVYLVH